MASTISKSVFALALLAFAFAVYGSSSNNSSRNRNVVAPSDRAEVERDLSARISVLEENIKQLEAQRDNVLDNKRDKYNRSIKQVQTRRDEAERDLAALRAAERDRKWEQRKDAVSKKINEAEAEIATLWEKTKTKSQTLWEEAKTKAREFGAAAKRKATHVKDAITQ